VEILTQLSYLDFRRIPASGMRFLGFSKSHIDNVFATSLLQQARVTICWNFLRSKPRKSVTLLYINKEKLICTV